MENFTPRFHVGKPNTEVKASPSRRERQREREERKYERKINDPASTLIIPIHKAWYPDTSATSGLIKNDDREGRKLQAAYRPINSTSARPATVSTLLARPPFRFHLVSFSSTAVAKKEKKKTCVIIANFQLNFPLTTIYDRINRLPGRQTIVFYESSHLSAGPWFAIFFFQPISLKKRDEFIITKDEIKFVSLFFFFFRKRGLFEFKAKMGQGFFASKTCL